MFNTRAEESASFAKLSGRAVPGAEAHSLRDDPIPHTDWYVFVSSITISADPMTLGVVKLIDLEGFSDLKSDF